MSSGVLEGVLQQLYTSYFKLKVSPPSPPEWSKAKLVLLYKKSKDANSPSAYRSICLLEVGKLFEQIIATRLVQHLSRVGPDLDGAQF